MDYHTQMHFQTRAQMSAPTRKRCRSRDDDSDDSDDLSFSSSSHHHHAKKTRQTLTAFPFTAMCARDVSSSSSSNMTTPSTTAPSTPFDAASMDLDDPSPSGGPEAEWESEHCQRLQENQYQLQSIQQQVQMHQLREIRLQLQAQAQAASSSSSLSSSSASPRSLTQEVEGEGGKRCTIIAGFNRGFGKGSQVPPTVQTSWGGGQGGGAFSNSNTGGYL
ncbi:hypothetical protein QBC42DRAFT_7392 [Cladorrhinum samala]|uniref:Uncharacterized protein n=1 Tax=Cladorrhinum samala TaxID=585594 RepID=A0AAV9HFP8_9PEZI|nr:hypothetical protein QBC42DRAFT_7392 [Cladorrhinum samala]